jgi:tyrosyl-tRNA synthetase
MKLSEDLVWRGLIKDKTFTDNNWLDEPKTFYLGIDASSDSLTIGNLAIVLLARRLAESGWKTVLLAGGATSLVGDPGGKKTERALPNKEEIVKNIEGIKPQMEKLLGQPHEMVNNIDWFSDIKFLDFLREVGKSFSMTELMQREFVSERLGDSGSGISYAEFSYSLIQGYDYWHLYKNKGVELQIGGSDQWGNMLSGVALIRKKESKEAQALSMPLVVNKQTGEKFGKSESGAIWLDSQKTTPTQFYQFWINTDDTDAEDYLKTFTLLTKEQVEEVMTGHKSDPSQRKAQKALAEEVTKIVHGDSGSALDVSKYLTGLVNIADATDEEVATIKDEIGLITASPGDSIAGILAATHLTSSNTEARRLLEGGAIYIDGKPVNREKFEDTDFKNNRFLLRRGKAYKDSVLVENHRLYD